MELKQSLRLSIMNLKNSQSHHSGIETSPRSKIFGTRVYSQSHHSGIETLVGHWEFKRNAAHNRTIVELKHVQNYLNLIYAATHNRTIVELKHRNTSMRPTKLELTIAP